MSTFDQHLDLTPAGETVVRCHTSLPPPKPFDGTSELWPRWRARFQRFRLYSGLSNKPEDEQVGTLLYSMGDIADDILSVVRLDEAKATYNEKLSALDGYFNSKKNTIFARARFNRRVQQSGESVDAFIQDLHRLADECNYLTLKEELIRDRIVVGVRDDELSKQLQGKQDLDLTEAIRLSRQAEARTEGQNILRPRVDLVHKFKPAAAKRFSQPKQQPQPSRANPGKKCGNCGKAPLHKKEACPARSAICHSCNKKGHYSSVCRSSKVRAIQVEEEEADNFLGSVQDLGQVDAWIAELHVDGYPSTFKLDTGAAVSVVGEDFADGRGLQPSDKILRGPGNTPLHVLGVFQACLKYKNRKIREALYIIQGQQHCLLSGSACARLGLVARLHSLTSGKADFIKEFPSLFKGLGKLKDPYTIKIRPGVQPSSIYTPRKILHPLMDKVKAEINRMLDDDVISPVEEPTEWCSGIVVVPKADRSSVRICVDLTFLNKAVLREVHPLSSVDEDLALAMDLFDLHGKTYLLLVEYHSRWPEIRLLDGLSSAAVIARLKSIFATHGIPDVLVSDNCPQFASAEFRKFTEEFCFTYTTSSPRYPQANGEAERAVQTIKNLLRKASDPYVDLLSYRATPLRNGYAPSELLMGRRLNTKLPSTRTRTSLPNLPSLLEKEGKYREQQRSGYNKRHSAKQASELQPGDYVFIKDLKRQGSVLTRRQNPRSYIICTDQGTIRRNRSHLVATPASSSSLALVSTQVREQSSPGHHVSTPRTPHSPRPSPTAVSEGNSETQPRVSRSGRPINPPKRLDL
ncbi:Pol polyprotein [Plakobranchus ocellatus]|uniref:Pol polyprotein n=1 Tax=Plakobranchus ocellatus TaxID=259542 RepID=A0AAV3Z8K9_9GAST|nr:Pol polyprotein [Plakobranchus ocellatus]